jgi:putative ABC transport system permease protein
VFGASPEYPEFDLQSKVAEGQFYTERDNKSLAPVAVLGSEVAEQLFRDENPIGKKIRLKGLSLEVVGVNEPRGQLGGFDFDSIVFVPLELLLKRVKGDNYVMEIDVVITESRFVEQTALEIERVLRREHGIKDPAKDDFIMTTSEEAIEVIGTVTNAITILLGLLAAVSLLVGGIGIMNIMLVSVTERIREVGLRKALGAKGSSIRNQFLMEAVLLTTFGGLLGGGFGTLMTLAIIAYARYTGFDVAYSVSLLSLGGAIVVAMIVGIIFGIYPARKAAKLDPIIALKYE